eukprot:CAMPEP_0172628500 /NCGR_PEP_ID=MMETSP1068-20121228/162215_1 /TAXON_ID=35684 /ORGANISM="Pseudopedinella elastica, Strain CCMP716" /LENGTH=33 /DNA_ID= /DNA_START= /DNA_END= /DNA_ORIENTATION=
MQRGIMSIEELKALTIARKGGTDAVGTATTPSP